MGKSTINGPSYVKLLGGKSSWELVKSISLAVRSHPCPGFSGFSGRGPRFAIWSSAAEAIHGTRAEETLGKAIG